MALSANTVWEVRTAGSDTNGGGFVAGASGTDWSQQDAAQYSVTDGVTAGSTTVTSATASFGTDVVGNIIYIQGGTGSVAAGWYQITARNSATSITVDRSTGLTAGTGVTLKIGGALLTIAQALALWVSNNKGFVKAGTYTTTATNTCAATGVDPSGSAPPNWLIGYSSTRGDNGQATIKLSTNSGLIGLNVTGTGWFIHNFIVDCSSLSTSKGIVLSTNWGQVYNCKVMNATSIGIDVSGTTCEVYFNEVTGCSGTAGISGFSGGTTWINYNYVHDNTCTGIALTGQGVASFNVCANNTGGSSDGISCQYGSVLLYNTCYGNGRDGIHNTNQYIISTLWRNNLLVNNVSSGINAATSSVPAGPWMDYNGFYGNGTAITNGTNTTGIFGVSPYTTHNVTLTADPFTNAAGGVFTLNSTAGGGAACRAAASPGVFPGSAGTSYADLGALQHQDSGGGGGGSSGMPPIYDGVRDP